MDRAKQREIASKGGKAAHQKGTAHEWTSEEARDAGRKGGIASHQRRREQTAPAMPMRRGNGPQQLSSRGSSTSDRESWSSERPSSTEPQMPLDRDEQ